jgi:hypothetical protein
MESFDEFANVDRGFIPPVYERAAHPWDRWKETNVPVSIEIYANRLKICESCPFYKDQNLCTKCGCHMPEKAKSFNAACPVRKW